MGGHCCLKCKETEGKEHGKLCTGRAGYVRPTDLPSSTAGPSATKRKLLKKQKKDKEETEEK